MKRMLNSLLMMGLTTLLTQNAASQFVADYGSNKAFSDRPFNSFSGSMDSATYINSVVAVEAQSEYCQLRNNGSTKYLGGGVYGYATRVKYNGVLYDAVNIKIRIYFDHVDRAMRAGIRLEDAATADSGARFSLGISLSAGGTLTYADGSSLYEDLIKCADSRLSYGRGQSMRQAETDEATSSRRALLNQFAVRFNMLTAYAPAVGPVFQAPVAPARTQPIRRMPPKFRGFIDP